MALTDSHSTIDVDSNDFDDFLSPDIVTSEPVAELVPNIFATPQDEADEILSLDKPAAPTLARTAADLAADAAAALALTELDEELSDEQDAPLTKPAPGRPRTDRSGLHSAMRKLVDEGTLDEFEAEEGKPAKALEDYTEAEVIELIQLNLKGKVDAVKAATPKEFYDSLPEELQYAAKYVNDGGQDLRSLFKVLSEVEDNKALDIARPADQEQVVRLFLQAKQFGSAADIEEQIDDYKAGGTLAKMAAKHKPALDGMQAEQVAAKLAAQELAKERQATTRKNFLTNVESALKPGLLSGVKIDRKTQERLYTDLTQLNFQLADGRRTNKLGHLMEKAQSGETPDYGLIAQVVMLLEDPTAYHEKFAAIAVSEQVIATARKLKTEAANKVASSGAADEPDAPIQRKKLARPVSIFTGK